MRPGHAPSGALDCYHSLEIGDNHVISGSEMRQERQHWAQGKEFIDLYRVHESDRCPHTLTGSFPLLVSCGFVPKAQVDDRHTNQVSGGVRAGITAPDRTIIIIFIFVYFAFPSGICFWSQERVE